MKGSFDMVQMLMSRLTSELHRRLRINPCWDRWSSWQFGTVYVLSQRQQTNLKRQMIATQKATPSLQPAIINVSDFPKDLWNLYALWNQLIIVNRRNWLTWYVKSFLAFPRVDHSDFSLFLCMYASFTFYYNQIWNTNKTTNNWILIECPPETKIFSYSTELSFEARDKLSKRKLVPRTQSYLLAHWILAERARARVEPRDLFWLFFPQLGQFLDFFKFFWV